MNGEHRSNYLENRIPSVLLAEVELKTSQKLVLDHGKLVVQECKLDPYHVIHGLLFMLGSIM